MHIDTTVLKLGKVDIRGDVKIGPYCVLGTADVAAGNDNRYVVTLIGNNTEIESNVVVGIGTSVGSNCWIDHHCYIGCFSTIGNHVQIMYGARIYHRVIIAEQAWIGGFVCNDAKIDSEAIIMGHLVHRFTDVIEGEAEAAPTIGARAFVGMGATVIGGIHIGDDAYIAAGAVVTRDVPPQRLFAGVPATDHGKAPSPFKKKDSILKCQPRSN